jgi:acylglycerol lipase
MSNQEAVDVSTSSPTGPTPKTITGRLAALVRCNKKQTPLTPEPAYPYELWGKTVHLGIPPDKFPSKEEIEEMEREMPGCEHGWFESAFEQKQLHYRKFMPPGDQKPKAIVVFHHGIQDHSGDAMIAKDGRKLGRAAMIDYFVVKRGYALYAMDQLGHGYSEGRRMFLEDYQRAVSDLIAFTHLAASHHHDSTPVFLCGHSFGGCLVLHAAYSFQTDPSKAPPEFRGIVLLAPAIVGDVPPFPVTYTLRYVLAPRYPTWTPFFMPNPVSFDRIWCDQEVLARHTNERNQEIGLDACGNPFALGTAVQLLAGLEDVRNHVIPSFTVPFCAVHGTCDYGVPAEGTIFLEQKSQSKEKKVLLVEGAYHDLLCDPRMEEAMDFVVSYIEERR